MPRPYITWRRVLAVAAARTSAGRALRPAVPDGRSGEATVPAGYKPFLRYGGQLEAHCEAQDERSSAERSFGNGRIAVS